MVATKNANTSEISSAEHKRNGFHGKYLEVCKSKNLLPLPEVKVKQGNIQVLEFHADRVKPYDWIAICRSLINDKSLKFIAIRLRKNNLLVLEDIDTLKKTKAIETHPVIYSKFLFTELVKGLKCLLTSNAVLETLTIEGLPLYGQYMTTFTIGLAHNTSIKTLSLTRSMIGDEACKSLCETLKHLMNIEVINLSGCNLGVKGAEAVADLIKYQKIQRFSEAWEKSLRYQDIDAGSFQGLRKILINNNPQIGDEGIELLTTVLCEDVWIKDIELQNCGIGDIGAKHIMECLNFNKTILSFNISGNPDVSDHLYRHILIQLGNTDQESSDSTDSSSSGQKITKIQLSENVKFLEEQLELEVFRRKQVEVLNENLNKQLVEIQQKLTVQGAFQVPDGFQLVSNNTINDLLKEKSIITKVPSSRALGHGNRRKRRQLVTKKVNSSSVIVKPSVTQSCTSEVLLKLPTDDKKKLYIERNIGDNFNTPLRQETASNDKPMTGAQLLQMFVKKKKAGEGYQLGQSTSMCTKNFDPRSLFSTRATINVPNNSDVDSDD